MRRFKEEKRGEETQMISFVNDYSENACPEILEALVKTNYEGNPGYSSDEHSRIAAEYIREKIQSKTADIQILSGGTQTNLIACAAFLRPHEAVIATHTGHICVHETGAIESTGHKCLEVEGKEGKVTPEDIERVCGPQHWDHAGILVVKPRMVYISQSTEVGTVYSKKELKKLRECCDKYNLLLFCDGARLSSALDCSDVTFSDLAKYCDAFYIGGTKNGALFGEAMVIVNPELQPEFRYIAKQHGGMLAKGWILGIQFEVLMRDGIYERCGTHANKMAMIMKDGLTRLGFSFTVDSPSNQQFVIFPNAILDKLKDEFAWENISSISEDYTEIRLCTSWATKESDVHTFLDRVEEIKNES